MVKLNSSEGQRTTDKGGLISVYRRIRNLFCCATCSEPTESPISVCPGGHIFCLSCRPVNQLICGICRKGMFPRTLNIINKISDLLVDEIDDGVTFENSLRDLFECPVCYKVAKSENEYEMCARGHLVCRFCYLMTAYCPLCRDSEQVGKNKLIDRILKEIRKGYKCRYTSNGCAEKCNLFSNPRHEDICKFKHFNCLVDGCKWRGTANQIQEHGLNIHKDLSATNNKIWLSKGKLQVRFGDDKRHPYWLLYDYSDEGVVIVVQSHCESPTNLTTRVRLEDCIGTGASALFSQPTVNMAVDPLAEFLSQDNFEIPGELISKYMNGGELNVNVIIEEEATKKAYQWLNTFNIFTAAFIVNFLLFSLKYSRLKQPCC